MVLTGMAYQHLFHAAGINFVRVILRQAASFLVFDVYWHRFVSKKALLLRDKETLT